MHPALLSPLTLTAPKPFNNRHAGDTAANLAVQLTSSQAGNPSLLGNDAGSTLAAAAAANVLQDSRFVRAAKTVGDCLGRVKTLSEHVNSATGFRESCSKLLGAAFAASLALQEVCVCFTQLTLSNQLRGLPARHKTPGAC